MIDPAFLPFSTALAKLLDLPGALVDREAGVRSHVDKCTIELPIELDVTRDEDGVLQLGSVPPLYYVDTTYQPAYHRIRFTAIATELSDAAEVPDGR
jgi:hypothetical protein